MGDTPLHFAIKSNQFRAIQQLLAGGADFEAKNSAGIAPYEIAKESRNPEILQLAKCT